MVRVPRLHAQHFLMSFQKLLEHLFPDSKLGNDDLGPSKLLENKIHPSKFEDLVGFIKLFMNCATSPLASTGML